uniref:Uncharacterized protein n=1 Tax=Helianthus annuus TaxID=4232 RepID=A0A251VBX9_HELAN
MGRLLGTTRGPEIRLRERRNRGRIEERESVNGRDPAIVHGRPPCFGDHLCLSPPPPRVLAR